MVMIKFTLLPPSICKFICGTAYPVYLDETATLFEQITVSGGMRGMLLLLSPSDYLRTVNGTLGAIVQN
jgi:prolyl-tRNA editing enzyme YbaK/EbsC (Cys-tRNA(Pro) deacylase)